MRTTIIAFGSSFLFRWRSHASLIIFSPSYSLDAVRPLLRNLHILDADGNFIEGKVILGERNLLALDNVQ
jgi:hypothetical protein